MKMTTFSMLSTTYLLLATARALTSTTSTTSRTPISSFAEGSSSSAGAATQNAFGEFSDAVAGAAFEWLHRNDESGIRDASKNLRVLWARAALDHAGKIRDEVASSLLPEDTRGVVRNRILQKNAVPFLEWIQARTEFIDGAVDAFLSSPVCKNEDGTNQPCQIVLFGAGYDTRALRYRRSHAKFIEVDLPDVVGGKRRLYQNFAKKHDPEWKPSEVVDFDLNDAVDASLLDAIDAESEAFRRDAPTLFVFEAVLFYVEREAIESLFAELFEFMNRPDGPESLLCMTDSLKPFVDVPFTSEADTFFANSGLDLLEHRSRWGGAVHFALAASRAKEEKAKPAVKVDDNKIETIEGEDDIEIIDMPDESAKLPPKRTRAERTYGKLGGHVASKSDALVYSYLPTRSNHPTVLDEPSFDDVWYAVAYPWQIDGYENAIEAERGGKKKETISEPFATRLWGEPVVIYRDADGTPVCVSDACPHRSAPLSMGTVENGELVCFYHGWRFGKDGQCSDVPSLRAVQGDADEVRDAKFRKKVSSCHKHHACVEHEGLIWLWRGDVLSADVTKLPSRRKGDMETITMDSVLDYNVDYSYIVENNLDSVHLFYLHDGSVPPLVSIGMMNKNLDRLRLSSFKDDCGIGHLGKLGDDGRPKKLIRFDPPNIVRHGGVSGFEEEFHIIPVAPHRTRVLLRQHIPKGPILSTITGLPGMPSFLTALVNNWNYHIGLEDASVMKGQSHLIEELGAPRMRMGSLGDDLVAKYWRWRTKAHENLSKKTGDERASPYFTTYGGDRVAIPTGSSIFGDSPNAAAAAREQSKNAAASSGSEASSEPMWGIKRTYSQNTPAPDYPPMNYKRYKAALRFDDLTKKILTGQEPSCTMIKTSYDKPKAEGTEISSTSTTWGKPLTAGVAASLIMAVAMSQGLPTAFADMPNLLVL